MFEIIERNWNGCEKLGTAKTLENAIEIAEKMFNEENGILFSEEESIEVWNGGRCVYMACGE